MCMRLLILPRMVIIEVGFNMINHSLDKIMDQGTQSICARLAGTGLMKSFYLAGGTGLALQLGHRRSLDLDFFQKGEKEKIPFQKINNEIKLSFGEKDAKLELRQTDQAVWEIQGVKVTFLAYPFPLVGPLVDGSSLAPGLKGIFLAAPREIALMKAYTIGRRATFRDYVDLFFLLKKGLVTLEEIICLAAEKFTIGGERVFSARLFLEQLVYTKDIEDKEIAVNLILKEQVSSGEVEDFLKAQVRRFLQQETNSTPSRPPEFPGGVRR